MSDKYDPKQTLRSPYGRPAESRPAPAPKEDPLAELARMVHGRANLEPQSLTRAPEEPAQPADLESELLNDLQASFAAVREAAAQVTARRPEPAPPTQVAAPRMQPAAPPPPLSLAPEPPRARPAPPAEVEYPSIFAPRTQGQPTPARPEGRTDAHPEIRPEFRLEPLDESRLVPIPSAPVIQPQVPPGYAERQAERAAAAAASEPLPRVLDRGQREMTPSEPAPEDDDFTAFQLRPSTAPAASPHAPAPPATPSRWEKPQPVEAAPVAVSRFAPPAAAGVAAEETFEAEEELDPFAEAGLFPVTESNDDEFETDEFGLPPDYPDDEESFAEPDEALPARRRPKAAPSRGMLIAAAVVAIALVGGISVAMFRTGQNSTGAPPTILADNAPTKITPDDSQTQASNDAAAQNKIIYDRVNSAEANNNTTLLTPDNSPLRTAPAPDTGNAISRVILPGGPGYDSAAGSSAPASSGAPDAIAPSATPSDDSDDSLGPRKVRTVVVKPDGTILSSTATNAPDTGASAPAAAPTTATTAAATETQPAAAPANPAPATDDIDAIAGTGGGALTITPNPDATKAPAIPPAPATAAAAAPAVPQARPPAKPAPATVAGNDANGPIDLTPAGTPATTALGQGFYVQVSSQHTEDAARATYKDLQARYPTILGKYGVDLQQASVPARGTFYRVRVGPFSAADAQRLCDDLKSAGGDCVLARH